MQEAICSRTLPKLKRSLLSKLERLTAFLRQHRTALATSSSLSSCFSRGSASFVSPSLSSSSPGSPEVTKTLLEISRIKHHVVSLTEQMNVVEELTAEDCGSLDEWAWFKQLKFERLLPLASAPRQEGGEKEGTEPEKAQQRLTSRQRVAACSQSGDHPVVESRLPLQGVEFVARMAHCTQVYGFEYQGNSRSSQTIVHLSPGGLPNAKNFSCHYCLRSVLH